MRSRHSLQTVNYSASGTDQILLRGLPTAPVGGKIPYLTAIEIDVNGTNLDTNGSVTVTALQLHNTLSSVTITDGAEPWGPVSLSGENLSQLFYLQMGFAIPYSIDANGDAAITNNTALTRRWKELYSFEGLGPRTDPFAFCPPCASLANGRVALTFSAKPTNAGTNFAIAYTGIAHVIWLREKRAVARVRSQVSPLVGSGNPLVASGLLLRLFARSSSAIVAGDFSALRLYADGTPIHTVEISPTQMHGLYDFMPKVSNAQLQETFADPIGGNNPLSELWYPFDPRSELGDLPVATSYKYDYSGSPTVANWSLVATYAAKQTPDHVRGQLAACGCSDDLGGSDIVPVGRGGTVLRPGATLEGYAPVVATKRGSPLSAVHQALRGAGRPSYLAGV